MQRYELRFATGSGPALATQSLDVPDIVTALVVADIVATLGNAELWQGEKRLAGLSRRSTGPRPLWQVD